MTGPAVVWIGTGLCLVMFVVAAAVLSLRRPCVNAGPRGAEPLLVLMGAMVGLGVMPVFTAVGAPGWVDVAVTAAVVGPLLAYAVVSGVGWIRDRRPWVSVDLWVDRDQAGVR